MGKSLSRGTDATLNKGTRRRRLNPAARRAELLSTALAVFARRGIGRATHAEVAEESGCSLATAFVYFPTREDLVAAVLGEVERFYTEMMAVEHGRELPGQRAIRHYVDAFTDSVGKHPDYARVWLEWSTAIRDEIWPQYLAFQERIVSALSATIDRGKADGTIAADIDDDEAARLMIGAAHMLVQMKFSGQPDEKISHFAGTLVSAVFGIR
jgi:TetR/AcrR family transcriptional regulator, hemagglutinin/protease regulatory protein